MVQAGSATVLRTGWVIVADIVGYSRKSDDRQRDLATFLIGNVETSHLHRTVLRASEAFSLACTGDGFILVVADDLLGSRGGEMVLRFVDETMRAVAAYAEIVGALAPRREPYDREFAVRMGIHRGDFSFETILGQTNAVGTGVNMACRIAGIGDAGHVLASGKAVDHLYDSECIPAGSQFVPLGEAGVKHDVGVFVYSYVRVLPRSANTTVGQNALPRLLERSVRVDELIARELERHRVALARSLKDHWQDAAGSRLTVLAPSADLSLLCVTPYRVVENEIAIPSRAAYRLEGTTGGRPEGISAIAYSSRQPSWIIGLVERYTRFRDYCAALSHVGLDEHTVVTFGRPCRSFIALHFRLPVATDAEYVLAFDSLAPLHERVASSVHGDADSQGVKWMGDFIQRLQESAEQIGRLIELRHPRPRGAPAPHTNRSP